MSSSRAVEALCLERRQRRRAANLYIRDNKTRDAEVAKTGIGTEMAIFTSHDPTNYGALAVKEIENHSLDENAQKDNYFNDNDNSKHSNVEISSTDSSSSLSSLDDIPVPLKLRPFVKRLGEIEDLTYEEICGILFIIRTVDSMLRVSYASFLTRSFVEELRKKLRVDDLDLEIEIAATRWTYQQGAIMTYHRFASDYDGYAMREISRIALGVLEDSISVTEGLQRIQICEERTGATTNSTIHGVKPFRGFEGFYRKFPGRITLFPLLASCGCVVYFGGTTVDFLVCIMTGTVAGIIHHLCSLHPQLSGVEEFLIAIATSVLVRSDISHVFFLR